MAVTSIQSREPKTYLRAGAIYRDGSHNIVRLISIRGDYCIYAYVSLGNPRPDMLGSVTGVTRKDIFEGGYVFLAELQRKSSNRRVQASHLPSFSLRSIDVALVSERQRRKS
jgi:hypothetical protein